MTSEARTTAPQSADVDSADGYRLPCSVSENVSGNVQDRDVSVNIVTTPSEAIEPCPSPMSWVDVVDRLRMDASSWEVYRGSYSIRCRSIGTGKPLYFLGGATGNSDLFALMAWLLKDDFRCVLYDYPDHSARNQRRRPLTIDDYVDDLISVVDSQREEQVSAYAISMGTPILLTAMRRQPKRFSHAIIQGGQLRLPLTGIERLMLEFGKYLPGKLRHLPGRDTIFQQNHRAWFPPFDFSRWNFFADVTGNVTLKTLSHRLKVMHRTDLNDIVKDLPQPVLIVGTEGEGPRLSAQRQLLEQSLSNCRTELLDTTGLVPFLTHPHRLKKIILPFLTCENAADRP
ncbi:MAG: alpha/beta hydrolase [Planctomycetota bacterium]|nr:alpha/beta hydrolase [Planctomycetota bacterium]MDA1212060.1 alpha/beta hydrolase [Planctomycetota bacterium]